MPFAATLISFGAVIPVAHAQPPAKAITELSADRATVRKEFATWGLGMFLHFNMATSADREWENGYEDPALFAPGKLDCNQWAEVARTAGMRYAILTAKHTGAWCLWPSSHTRHGMQSFRNFQDGKGDIVRQFVDAFRARGLKVGLYYCFPGNYAGSKRHDNPLPAGMPDLHGLPPEAADDYVGFLKKQLLELLENYHPDLLWIDQYNNRYTGARWPEIAAFVHETAPGCILIANNSRQPEQSDALSYEWPLDAERKGSKAHGSPDHTGELPPDGNQQPAEVCDTIQTQARWFWHPRLTEGDLQAAALLVRTYGLCRARGANYLLNIAPDREGLIPQLQYQRLQDFRKAIAANDGR